MFTVALPNAMGGKSRGDRPTEEVLILAYGESGTAERGRNILMRWRRGELSGHELALGEMLLPVRPMQPLIEAKRCIRMGLRKHLLGQRHKSRVFLGSP